MPSTDRFDIVDGLIHFTPEGRACLDDLGDVPPPEEGEDARWYLGAWEPCGWEPDGYVLDRAGLRHEIRGTWDSSDPWGSCMAWAFAVAEELAVRGEGEAERDAAGYRPGLFGPTRDPSDCYVVEAANADTDALCYWLRRLSRWADYLRACGRDY